METYKKLIDSLSEQLLAACKQKKDKAAFFKQAEDALESGAAVNYKGSKPIYFAVKNYNFELIKLLIRYGAMENEVSRKFLASMCERGGFTQKKEDAFFEVIDISVKKTGFDPIYIIPYINATLLTGRIDKLCRAVEKYGLNMKEALGYVRQMIIFEIIDIGKEESLNLINSYIDWQEGAIDLAVSTGKLKAAEYILFKNRDAMPSKDSIVKAIVAGDVEMLEILNLYAINLTDEVYVKAACQCYATAPAPLKFLAEKGATWVGYDGKSLYENAMANKDKNLLEFVKSLSIIQL